MVVNLEQRLYTGLKKTGAFLIALVLTLDIGGSFFYAQADNAQKSTTYTPGSVHVHTGTNTSHEWRNITNILEVSLPFNAHNNAFNTNNSAVLALTSAPDIIEVVEPTPEPAEPQGGGGGAPQQEEDDEPEAEAEAASSTPEVIEEDNASTTPEIIVEEPAEEVASSTPEVVEEESETPAEEPEQVEEEVIEEETPVEEEEPIVEEVEETPTPPVEEPAQPETPTPAPEPEPEQVETSSLFGSLKTVSLFASLGESLLPTKTLLATTTPEEAVEEEEPETIPSLTISNFTPDTSDADLRFKAADLYISLSGEAIPGATLIIEYGTDNTWTAVDTISFDTPHSNKTNGDYFKTTLTDITSLEDIENLSVRLTYVLPDGASIPLSSQSGFLYIDGLHLETTSEGQILDPELTLFPEAELIETRTPEEQALARLEYANNIFELLKNGSSTEAFKILNKKFLEESPLELSLVGAATTSEAILTPEGDVVYRDIYPATDFIYRPTETGLKEEILLKDPSHPGDFTYLLNLDDFDYEQTEHNEIVVYQKGFQDNPLKKLYTISAPYMEDALGERSENLSFVINENEITLIPDYTFLETAVYPVLIDPTIDIEVLTTYQHPLTGENWVVDFATVGESDLYITPRNQVTIDEIEFVSLTCDGEERIPDIQAGEVLYYPNWSCDGIGTVTHLINLEGGHILDFTFGGGEEAVVMDTAFNGTVTWDGGGATNNWSECANWSADACPLSGDDVVFDGTSTKDATLDTATTVRDFTISAGYSGTITQSDGADLDLRHYTQAAGTFTGGAATSTYTNSNFTITGGTHNAPSTTVFSYTTSNTTINVNSSQTFANLLFQGNNVGHYHYIANGDTLVANGTLEVSGRTLYTGGQSYIDARGDIIVDQYSSGGNVIIDFGSSDAQTVTYEASGGVLPIIRLDDPTDANDTIDVGEFSDVRTNGFITTAGFSSGTFSLTNATSGTTFYVGRGTYDAGTITIGGAGTLYGGEETWWFNNENATISSGGVFSAPSTTVWDMSTQSNKTLNVDSSQTFENLTFRSDTIGEYTYVASGDTLVVTGTLTTSGRIEYSGSQSYIDARGDIVADAYSNGGTIIIDFGSSDAQTVTFTEAGDQVPTIRLDNPEDANDTIDVGTLSDVRANGFITTSGFSSGTFSLTNATSGTEFRVGRSVSGDYGTTNFAGNGGVVYGGEETWRFYSQNITFGVNGAFSAPTTTIVDASLLNLTMDLATTQTFENLTYYTDSGDHHYLASGDTVIVNGDLVLSGRHLYSGSQSYIEAQGDITLGSDMRGGSVILDLDSSDVQTITPTEANDVMLTVRLDDPEDANDIFDWGSFSTIYLNGLVTTAGFAGGTFELSNATSGTTVYVGRNDLGDFGSTNFAGGTVYGGEETWQLRNQNVTVASGGTFSAPSTTIFRISSYNLTIDVNSSQMFEDLEFDVNGNGGNYYFIASGDTLAVTGTTTLKGRSQGGTIEARGDLTIDTVTNTLTTDLLFTGSSTSGKANQTFDISAITPSWFDNDFTVNKSEGVLTLVGALDMNATNQDLTVTEGTLYLNGYDVTVDGTSGTFVVEDGGTLRLQGGETIIANTDYPSYELGSTVEYVGDGDAAADTYDLLTNVSYSLATLNVNFTDVSDTLDGDTVTIATGGESGSFQAFWDMDEASGTTATDESGQGNDVSLFGSPPVVAGQYGNARNFEAGDYGTFTAISPTDAYTVMYWSEFPLPATGGGYRTPFARSGGNYHHLIYETDGRIGVYDSGWYLTSYDTDGLSGWHHVAAVGSGGNTEFFIDGTSVGSVATQITEDISIIGNFSTGGNQNAGKMDEVYIYTRALSESEIETHYSDTPILPASPGDVDIKNLTLTSGIFTAPSTTLSLDGDFTNAGGTFTHNSGTVQFDGVSQTISGDNTFYNLTRPLSTTTQATLTFAAGDRQTVTNSWSMVGTSSAPLILQSSSGGSQWEIDPQNLYTVEYVTVSDSNNVGSELSINESIVTNGGNNTNWGFNNLPTASSLGPSEYTDGSWGTDTTPTLTLTTSDADAENMRFHIVIDDSSDFSSPVVNYTSGLEAGGSKSFTVGQAEGSGTYTTGSSGQTLSTGSYYWRASATDASGGGGATTTANSGAVAFRLDTTAPTAGTAATSSVAATTVTVTISGASDADSGLSATPYNFHDQTEDNYSGAQSGTSYQFTGLVPDTEYVFEVQVTDTAGNTATSSTVTERTLASIPTSPSATANSETAITFSWNGGTNPPTVSYYPVNITSSTSPDWISAKTYQFTGLTCATTYEFEVKARNTNNISTGTTTRVSAATNACGSDSEGEEGGGEEEGSGETGGGGGGSSGGGEGSSPTITYTQTSQTPVDTSLQTFTIVSDNSETTESTTVVSENRVIYLTFEPPANTQYVIIANNPDFEGGEYFIYQPDFAVQWNVCKAEDGTILPDSECARNLEYNVYIKFVNYQGLESTVTTQTVFLYDPILPDSFFEFPEQNITVDVLEQRRVVTLVEFPFDDPFTDVTGVRTKNTFGEIINNVIPGSRTNTTETNVPAGFVDAATQYKAALKASYNITLNVVGTITKYVTKVVNNPFSYIRDNVTTNIYMDGLIEGFGKVKESSTKVTLTRFEWLFGNPIDTGTSGGGEEEGTIPGGGEEPGAGTPPGGGTPTNPIIAGTTNTNETVRTVVSGIAGNLSVTDEQVKSAATVAAVVAPGLLALQQALGFALFAGAFAWADLLWLLLRWLHDLATFFHMRNKRRTWGYVYDAKTKMPLEPVLVELIDTETGRVIDRSVTDQTGQFGFIPRVGHFRIEARKANYAFPSKKVAGSTDGAYEHIYHGESFTITDTNKVIAPNIPMDAVREDQGQLLKGLYLKLHLLEHNWGHRLATLVFWVGFLIVSANLMISLTPLNVIIFGFYLVLVSYRYVKLGTRLWGHLENIPELPQDAQIILELTHRKSPDILVGRALAQPDGKFFLKTIEPGTYVLSVKVREGKKESLLLKEDVAVGNDLVINHDIYLG